MAVQSNRIIKDNQHAKFEVAKSSLICNFSGCCISQIRAIKENVMVVKLKTLAWLSQWFFGCQRRLAYNKEEEEVFNFCFKRPSQIDDVFELGRYKKFKN